jgi:hypothetical protein
MFFPCGTASSFTEPFYLSSPRSTTTAWDARSSSSSPELGYGNDFISTPMPAFDWTQANVNIFSHIYLLLMYLDMHVTVDWQFILLMIQ